MKNTSVKRTISLLLWLVLLLGIVPMSALAIDTPPTPHIPTTVYVNGVDVEEIDAEDDTISWDEETNTLTLNNASILVENGTYKGSGIYAVGTDTLVLELVGDNTVEGKFNGSAETYTYGNGLFANAAISVTEGLTIRGTGTLTATDLASNLNPSYGRKKSAGIFAGGDLTIEDGTVNATSASSVVGDSAGIICGDYDTLSTMSVTGGSVTATGYNSGIYAFDTICISGGTVNAFQIGAYGYGMYADCYEDQGFHTGIFITGGVVTSSSDDMATYALMDCSGYKNPMWSTAEDGHKNYGSVPGITGVMNSYLRIEPADLQMVYPTAGNRYTADVEKQFDEEITVDYQWYEVSSNPIVSDDVFERGDCTFDEDTALWTILPYEEGYVAYWTLDAQVGDIITLEFLDVPENNFVFIMSIVGTFEERENNVYSYTVTELDIDPDTGLLLVQMFSLKEVNCKITRSCAEEVETLRDNPNQFGYNNSGEYFCVASVYNSDGTLKGELRSDSFAYEESHTVFFDANGGFCVTESADTKVGFHTLNELPVPTREGYKFAGWFDAPQGGDEITLDSFYTEDTTIYAQWTANEYTLTVQGISGILYEIPVAYGADLPAVVAGLEIGDVTTEDGVYTFAGTYDLQIPETMPATNLVLTAQYTYTPKGELVFENGAWYYYRNDTITYAGLIELDGHFYYIRSNGQAVTGRTYWITKTNGLLPAGNYTFDAEGKLVPKNGLFAENGGLYYYVDGERNYAGLIEINGNLYYIRSNGQAATGRTYWVTKTNGLLPAGNYTFDAEGKLVPKNGLFAENGGLYYYVDGERNYAGLIEIDGNLYYIRSNGQAVTGRTYWTTKTNGLQPAANYQFDENGILLNAPV